MVFNKIRFFLLVAGLAIAPFLLYKLGWILQSQKTEGVVGFTGKEYAGQIVRVYSVIFFQVSKDTFWFNSSNNVLFEKGQMVPIRYLKSNPYNARVNQFTEIWGDTLVYAGIPLLIIIIIFIHPKIIPARSIIRIQRNKPFLSMDENKAGP